MIERRIGALAAIVLLGGMLTWMLVPKYDAADIAGATIPPSADEPPAASWPVATPAPIQVASRPIKSTPVQAMPMSTLGGAVAQADRAPVGNRAGDTKLLAAKREKREIAQAQLSTEPMKTQIAVAEAAASTRADAAVAKELADLAAKSQANAAAKAVAMAKAEADAQVTAMSRADAAAAATAAMQTRPSADAKADAAEAFRKGYEAYLAGHVPEGIRLMERADIEGAPGARARLCAIYRKPTEAEGKNFLKEANKCKGVE